VGLGELTWVWVSLGGSVWVEVGFTGAYRPQQALSRLLDGIGRNTLPPQLLLHQKQQR